MGGNDSMERQEGTEISFTTSTSRSSTSSGGNAEVLLDYMGPDSKRSARIRPHTQKATYIDGIPRKRGWTRGQ
jgi:hypothetical protein